MVDLGDVSSHVMLDLMQDIMRDVVKAENASKDKAQFFEKVGTFLNGNTLLTERNMPKTLGVVDSITRAYDLGVRGMPIGGTREVTREIIRDSSMQYLTKMGEDMKEQFRKLMADDIDSGLGMRDISKDFQNAISTMANTRADTIARTETVRARNLADYVVAEDKGYECFMVISADTCCEICAEVFPGKIFQMDDLDMLPPIHPRCRCTGKFYRTEDLGQKMADEYEVRG
jgi:SPP1 gp7 family putative phage head morphogenesis protein